MSTDLHGIPIPNAFDNYVSDYEDLLQTVDEGIVIFGGQATVESKSTDASSPVFAIDENGNRVWKAEGGTASLVGGHGTSSDPIPQTHVTDQKVHNLQETKDLVVNNMAEVATLTVTDSLDAPELSTFLKKAGGQMSGSVEFNNNDITGVGTMEVTGELIVPTP